jgi:hypothetical protein
MFLCLYAARLGCRSSKASLESICRVATHNLSGISCEDYYGCPAWDLVGHRAATAGSNTHRNVAPFRSRRSNRRGFGETHRGSLQTLATRRLVPCQQGRFDLLMWSYLLYLFHFNFLQSMMCHDKIGCCKKHLLPIVYT